MPIQDMEPGTSPEAPGTFYFYKQGSAQTSGTYFDTEGNATFNGDVTVTGDIVEGTPTPAWINVQKYGASPSASAAANDTAIAAAIAAIPANGGTLYFPAGSYNISAAIAITTDGVSVRGDGMAATVIEQTSTTAHGISIIKSGPRYSFISDLKLSGPSSGTGQGIRIETTTATATASVDVARVFIEQFGGDGINADTIITSVWQDVRVANCGGVGFAASLGTSLILLGCYATSTTGAGYHFTTMSYSSLIGCAADNTTGNGYTIQGGTGNSLTSCGFEDGAANGYVFTAANNTSAYNCYNRLNAGIAFHVTGSSNRIALMNCRETSPDVGATAGVQVDAGSTATLINNQTSTANSLATSTTNQFLNTNLEIHSSGTATARIDRAANTNFASYTVQTAGTDRWTMGLRNDTTEDLQLLNPARSTVAFLAEDRATATNLSLLSATKSYGGGVGVVFLTNATTVPTTNPTGGGILYVEAGALKYRGTGGTVTTLGPA